MYMLRASKCALQLFSSVTAIESTASFIQWSIEHSKGSFYTIKLFHGIGLMLFKCNLSMNALVLRLSALN